MQTRYFLIVSRFVPLCTVDIPYKFFNALYIVSEYGGNTFCSKSDVSGVAELFFWWLDNNVWGSRPLTLWTTLHRKNNCFWFSDMSYAWRPCIERVEEDYKFMENWLPFLNNICSIKRENLDDSKRVYCRQANRIRVLRLWMDFFCFCHDAFFWGGVGVSVFSIRVAPSTRVAPTTVSAGFLRHDLCKKSYHITMWGWPLILWPSLYEPWTLKWH